VLNVIRKAAECLRPRPRSTTRGFPTDADLDLFADVGKCLAEPTFAGWLDQLEAVAGETLRPDDRQLAIDLAKLATQSDREKLAQLLQQIRQDEYRPWYVADELASVGLRVWGRLTGDLTGWGGSPPQPVDANETAPPPAAPPKTPPNETPAKAIELVPGGFYYGGHFHEMNGRARDMLEALINARHQRMTADQLIKEMRIDSDAVEYPKQAVQDAATDLRKSLKAAIQQAGQKCDNPLQSSGKAQYLAYALALPV
jgi:hypothetical protein